jgi:nicotinamide-nucleotide amidase
MKACIVSIGDEVLSGNIVNTNASYLASLLSQFGFSLDLQLVISDFDPDNASRFLKMADEFSVIICTGGLGPTIDDMTRSLFAKLSHKQLIYDPHLGQDLKERFGDTPYHRLQAMVPENALLLKNSIGTAAGLCIKVKDCLFIALPGVPYEMKVMFENEVIPLLTKSFPYVMAPYEKMVNLFDLIEVDIDPYLKKIQAQYPKVSCGIYPSYGVVRLMFKGSIQQEVEQAAHFFEKLFKANVFESSNGKIEKAVFDLLKKHHKTLAMAESITGGSMASRLVAISGISSYFLGSLVVYSDELKKEILGIHPQILKTYGAVSKETADAMVSNLLAKTQADCAIAVTGIAGPDGGSKDKPVGLVYIGIGIKNQLVKVFSCNFKGDREIIREKTATFAFGYLVQYLKTLES